MNNESIFQDRKPELPLEKTPFIGSYIKKIASNIDQEVYGLGIAKGIENYFKKNNSLIYPQYDSEETRKLLHEEKKPVILAYTHESLAEPLSILASLATNTDTVRNDISIVVADGLPQYANLNKYFIPLYNTAPTSIFRADNNVLKSLGGGAIHLDRKIAFEENKKSFQKIQSDFNQGNLILFSPEGNLPKNSSWSASGLKRLVTSIGENSDGHLIFVNPVNVGISELYKLFTKPIQKFFTPFYKIETKFSTPIKISDILKHKNNGEDINIALQNKYKNWVSSGHF